MNAGIPGVRRSFTDRMIAAARLDISLYEEVEADRTATGQAAAVVALSAVASAIGASGSDGIFVTLVASLLGWAIWAGITYLIGTKAFHGTATWGELARTLGFAQAPGLLNILGIIPLLGWVVRFAVGIWILIAGIIAIRQALDITTGKAVIVAVLGWLALVALTAVAAFLF